MSKYGMSYQNGLAESYRKEDGLRQAWGYIGSRWEVQVKTDMLIMGFGRDEVGRTDTLLREIEAVLRGKGSLERVEMLAEWAAKARYMRRVKVCIKKDGEVLVGMEAEGFMSECEVEVDVFKYVA